MICGQITDRTAPSLERRLPDRRDEGIHSVEHRH